MKARSAPVVAALRLLLAGLVLAAGSHSLAAVPASADVLADRTEAVLNDLSELRAYVFERGEPRWLKRLEDVAGRLLLRAMDEPDPAKAAALLNQAMQLTGVAWAGLASQAVAADPSPAASRTDASDRLLRATRALAEAYRRVGRDTALAATLPLRIEHALGLADLGARDAADAELRTLYNSLKASLAFELDGTTVVRALEFRQPRDEYQYELDRHEAYLLMLRQFFPEASADPDVAAVIAEAARHHVDAHQQALRDNYDQAIWVLEHSNGELARVLRDQGLDVPG